MRRAYAYTLVVVVCWGISLPANKALLLAEAHGSHLSTLQAAFWGIAAGWVALLAVLALRRRLGAILEIRPRGWVVLAAMGFFGWAGYVWALYSAFVRIPLPDAIIINYLHPVFVVLFQGRAFGAVARLLSGWEQAGGAARRPAFWRMGTGLALCLCGVALIATGGRLAGFGSLGLGTGALAALFAAFSWGVYSNLPRFIEVRPGSGDRGRGDIETWLAMTFGLLMLGAALWVSGGAGSPSGRGTPLYLGSSGPHIVSAWAIVALMGLLPYCTGYSLWLMALELGRRYGGAHKLPPLTYLTPVLGVLLGRMALHEPFGAGFWQGAALIAVGNLVIALTRASPFGFAQGRRSPRPDS